MQRRSRAASVIAIALLACSAVPVAHAASTGFVLYVDNTNSACTDSGTGTAAAPFCTVQAAFNDAAAGKTVEIEAGTYTSPATLTASGTADAPITVRFGWSPNTTFNPTTAPGFALPQGSKASALTISGASYVDVDYAMAQTSEDYADAVSVTNSSHVEFDGGFVNNAATDIGISGTSSDVTVEQMSLLSDGTAVSIGSAATDTVVTTNEMDGDASSAVGVAVNGASGTDIVSNTMGSECIAGISVSGGATATTVENNVITTIADDSGYCSTDLATALGLNVSSDSAAGTTEKYDTISTYDSPAVEWAGQTYTATAAFQTATGQGTADYLLSDNTKTIPAGDTVDSADALAPGELATDRLGNSRVDDPQVPDTGTGVGYYDRGSTELQDPMAATLWGVAADGGLSGHAVYKISGCGQWSTSFTGSIAWGDGTSTPLTTLECSGNDFVAAHTYPTPGKYEVDLSATDGIGNVVSSADFTTAGGDYTPLVERVLDTRATKTKVGPGHFVKVDLSDWLPSNAQAVALNLTVTNTTGGGYAAAVADGAGAPSTSNVNFGAGQTVANSTIVPVAADGSIDIYNESKTSGIDVIADMTGYFSPKAASGYAAVAPDRILDTRKGIGAAEAQAAAYSVTPVAVAGLDGIPATASAVAVHVTVTDTLGGGFVAAEPDGDGLLNTSSVNFGKGQTVSNTVIVPLGSDGKIELYNGATGPVDLIADVAGYFSTSAPNVYVPEAPQRVLDTRSSGGPLASDTAYEYPLANSGSATVAVVANLTATEPTASGNLEAYPVGTTRPGVSNVNFGKGQTIANLALLDNSATTGADTEVYNDSTGTDQLIIDVFGYFTSD